MMLAKSVEKKITLVTYSGSAPNSIAISEEVTALGVEASTIPTFLATPRAPSVAPGPRPHHQPQEHPHPHVPVVLATGFRAQAEHQQGGEPPAHGAHLLAP